jgi:hypothetical protein
MGCERRRKGEKVGYEEPTTYGKTAHFRNRQVASSTLALGSNIPLEDKDLANSLNCLCRCRSLEIPRFSLSVSIALTCDLFTLLM